MIRSYRHKGLRRFAETGDASKLSVRNTARIARLLASLEASVTPEGMNVPGYRFHALRGDRAGRYSVDASGNWRITFGWDGQHAVDVDLEDYH
ncbi:MAG TPA: type II toxin-antitoxin system RelE/ParE family toxin [Caulobacteraceae bacterium]|nr:type II toxin-antitoxin system RelE/ParE family toxin [Caulobacteraceae bacterium]